MKHGRYPEIKFELESGRIVSVHGFAWEPTYDEKIELQPSEKRRDLLVTRKRLKTEILFQCDGFHLIGPEYVDRYINDPPRIPDTAIHLMLASTPMSEEAAYSELVVLFFMDYVQGISLEAMLAQQLNDLDWDAHAVDVIEESVQASTEDWGNSVVH